jgi:FkbM family methyltransferase
MIVNLKWQNEGSNVMRCNFLRKQESNSPSVAPTDNSDNLVTTQNVKIGTEIYPITSDDDYLTKHIGSIFEPHMCRLFLSLIEKDHVVLDIGANIGCTSILFGQNAKEVISFEPSPTTFNFLELNVKNSKLNNITLHNIGLGSTDEDLSLTFRANNRSAGFVSNKTQISDDHTTEPIHIRNGDAFLKDSHIDFIKIDVEGFEMNVIKGIAQTIQKNKPVVVSELNHWCLNAFQRTSIPDYFDYLLSIFPIIYAVDGETFADLRDPYDRYEVMHNHIVHFKYSDLVCAFDQDQLKRFLATYSRQRSS